MSMISAQCDELRNAADELQDIIDNGHNYTWHGIFTILHYAQQELRGAADIMWELRNRLVDTVDQSEEIERLQDENARLRSCLSDDAKNARQIMGENAKLRELVKNLYECNGSCERCIELMGRCEYKEQLMELGIGVEDA